MEPLLSTSRAANIWTENIYLGPDPRGLQGGSEHRRGGSGCQRSGRSAGISRSVTAGQQNVKRKAPDVLAGVCYSEKGFLVERHAPRVLKQVSVATAAAVFSLVLLIKITDIR